MKSQISYSAVGLYLSVHPSVYQFLKTPSPEVYPQENIVVKLGHDAPSLTRHEVKGVKGIVYHRLWKANFVSAVPQRYLVERQWKVLNDTTSKLIKLPTSRCFQFVANPMQWCHKQILTTINNWDSIGLCSRFFRLFSVTTTVKYEAILWQFCGNSAAGLKLRLRLGGR